MTVLLPPLVLGFRIPNIVQSAFHSQGRGSKHKAYISMEKAKKAAHSSSSLGKVVTRAKVLGKLLFQLYTVISVFT